MVVEKEYVERNSLMKKVHTGMNIIEVMQAIIDEPAADVVEVRKGRWIQHYVGQERTPWGSDCSVCGEWLVIDRLVMQEKYHYCPNCGAKMDGGADDGKRD